MQFFWNVLTNAGPLACLVAFHAWQGHRREDRFEKKVDGLQQFQTSTLATMASNNAQTIKSNTHALERNTQALNRLEFVADSDRE